MTKIDNDTYWQVVEEQYYSILLLYRKYSDKKPVMLFDIQEQRGYAYPYEDFKVELSARSQEILDEQYQNAILNNQMVVFIRDNVNRKLVSYVIKIGDINKFLENKIKKNIIIKPIKKK